MTRIVLAHLAVFALVSAFADSASADLVVESVVPGQQLDRAGMREGDEILSWERLPGTPPNERGTRGDFTDPFDWREVHAEQASRGAMRLIGQRNGEPIVFETATARWDAEVRPRLPDAWAAGFTAGLERWQEGDGVGAAAAWSKLLDTSLPAEPALECWLRWRIARAHARAHDWQAAQEVLAGGLEIAPRPMVRLALLDASGAMFRNAGEREKSIAVRRQAMAIREQRSPGGLQVAYTHECLGFLAFDLDRLDEARAHHEAALAIHRREVPGSLLEADSLGNLGNVAVQAEDYEAALEYQRAALAIQKRRAPGSVNVAVTLNNLGIIMNRRGDFEAAADYFQRTLEIDLRLAPESLDVAGDYQNLGSASLNAGDLFAASAHLKSALELLEKLNPEHVQTGETSMSLAEVAFLRGDYDAAEAHCERALGIYSDQVPGTERESDALFRLGQVAAARGDYGAAATATERGLVILRALRPRDLSLVSILGQLGEIALAEGDFAASRSHLLEALALAEEVAPHPAHVAAALTSLARLERLDGRLDEAAPLLERASALRAESGGSLSGRADTLEERARLAAERGDLTRALPLAEECLELRRRVGPDAEPAIEARRLLAQLQRRAGNVESAVRHALRNLDALDHQVGHLGGTHQVRTRFRAERAGIYRQAIELLLEQGRAGEAFEALERSHARGFLELLAERDLVLTSDLPAEIEAARRRTAALYDRAYRRLAELEEGQSGQESAVAEVTAELARLRREHEEIVERARRASPRVAALRYPRPLGLSAAIEALEPGTAALAYSVGETSSTLFVLRPDEPLATFEISLGREALSHEVSAFLTAVEEADGSSRAHSGTLGRRLFDQLLAPAAPELAFADRLLLLPDGPLVRLPFAALRLPASGGEGERYLVEAWPLHVAASMTVYAQLAGHRPSKEPSLVAFGAPGEAVEREGTAGDFRVRLARGRAGFEWAPLPWSRHEVEGIANLVPSARIYLGAEATEERAKSEGRGVDILHFATHGHLDEARPLDSALVLAIPNRDDPARENGLLQVWEIIEQVRVDADLVVLSACRSGLGEELSGEGLIGLTRAFHHAGAGTVAATLWPVADQPTSDLMLRFYRHLASDLGYDEALRAAQLELLRETIEIRGAGDSPISFDASAPYYWAGFQLFGDRR